MYTKVLLISLALSFCVLYMLPKQKSQAYIPAVSYEVKEEFVFISPLKNGEITSRFGLRNEGNHDGLDIAVPQGTPIFASQSGVVRFCGALDGYGLTVVITHENGYMTLYAHCDSLNVCKDELVSTGKVIAYSGNSGSSTGPHLHFEIRKDEKPLNPEDFIKI